MNKSPRPSSKKIAIFLPGLYDGGAERVMLNLASGLVDLGYQVDMVLAQAEGPFLDKVPDQVKLIELNKRHHSALRTISSLPSLVQYIRFKKPDVMLSGLNYANVIAVWAKILARVPLYLCITEHNTISIEKVSFPPLLRWMLLFFMRVTYRMADKIIAVSEGVAEDLVKELGISRNKLQVIYNPVITPELQEKIEQPLDDNWLTTEKIPVVLAMGRLTRQKGFDILLRAFAEVRKQQLVRLIILGEGEDRNYLQNLCEELELQADVRLPGFIPNPYPYLANASLFVLSSRWEGLPTVLVEALYCGIPIIATDCPSGPREILKNGLYGRLVPVEDIGNLSQAILTALNNPNLIEDHNLSWREFELQSVMAQYLEVLLKSKNA